MKNQDLVGVFSRLVAFFAGFPPTEVWRSYRQFEDDQNSLFELFEALSDEAKPILEERERRGRK